MLMRPVCITVAITLLLIAGVRAADASLHSLWGELLKAHVADGKVDYQGFKQDEGRLDMYLETLNKTEPSALSEQDRLAFYINVYNAYTVKLILAKFKDNKPVRSIKDIGGFFQKPWSIEFVRVGGRKYTLDNIEHDIIRPQFREPRVHFAVNCASKSCPPLISEPYSGKRLERQLEENTIRFINDEKFNYISGNTLYVTKIFKWFGDDFDNDPVSFVKKYARGELLDGIEAAGASLNLRYLDYDWTLNGR